MPPLALRLIYLSLSGVAGWMVARVVKSYLRTRDYFGDFPDRPWIAWGDIDGFSVAAGVVFAAVCYGLIEWRVLRRPDGPSQGTPRSRSEIVASVLGIALGLGALAGVAVGYLFLRGPTLINPEYGIFWLWISIPLFKPVGVIAGGLVAWCLYRAMMRRAVVPAEDKPGTVA